MTNFKTIQKSIKRLKDIEKMEEDGTFEVLPKIEVLGLRDTVFEYEVTSNRVDCFGILGIARGHMESFIGKF